MQDIFDWVWKKIGAKRVVRQCIETSKLLGTAIAHVYWDEHTGVLGGEDAYYEGEIRICEIDPANFFPDPTAYRLQDCQYIHVVEKKPRKWVESVFKVKLDERGGDTGNDPYIEPMTGNVSITQLRMMVWWSYMLITSVTGTKSR